MKLFESRKKRQKREAQERYLREQEIIALKEQQRKDEFDARMKTKRSLKEIKKYTEKLASYKDKYINKARDAALQNDEQNYNIAKTGLKVCMNKQKFLESLVMNFELMTEINDMNKVMGKFTQSINHIVNDITRTSGLVDYSKAQQSLEQAMHKSHQDYEALEDFISTASDSLEQMTYIGEDISDEDLENIIFDKKTETLTDQDADIERMINQVKDKVRDL